jgi:hypothetical protein
MISGYSLLKRVLFIDRKPTMLDNTQTTDGGYNAMIAIMLTAIVALLATTFTDGGLAP